MMAPLSQTVWEWSPGPRKKGRREITDPPQRRSWAGSGSLKRHGPPERAVGPVIRPHNSNCHTCWPQEAPQCAEAKDEEDDTSDDDSDTSSASEDSEA